MNPILRRVVPAVLGLALAACSSDSSLPPTNPFKGSKSERELRLEADGLYKLARRSLDSSDYQGAITRYGTIMLRYPFTDYATQAQLESAYAKYRAFDPDGALSAADRFLKEHPRHPAVDYVQYLKGLINFQRGESILEGLVDSSGQDVSAARQAFDDFSLLTQRYPKSRYVGDARLRMVHLRNKIAAHELTIVRYYIRRGAHIAAARRAESIIADYPGAPAGAEALVLLENSYREAGLVTQADEVRRLRQANPAVTVPEAAPEVERPGGIFGPPPDPIPENAQVSAAPVTRPADAEANAPLREMAPEPKQ
jgi:outer membrane protein assembly factor BamD